MSEQEFFAKKAENGYTVCEAKQCRRKESCLLWKVGQNMPASVMCYTCVNQRYPDVATAKCPHYRKAEKVQMAKGMLNIFNGDMPRRVEPYVRQKLISHYNHTYYYEYRRGARLIPPVMQEEIRQLFREAGWSGEVHFDGYVEDYVW